MPAARNSRVGAMTVTAKETKNDAAVFRDSTVTVPNCFAGLGIAESFAFLGCCPVHAYRVDARCHSLASLSRRGHRATPQSHFCGGRDVGRTRAIPLSEASHTAEQGLALDAAVLIPVCGLTTALVRHKLAKQLKLLEISAWVAVAAVSFIVALLLLMFARSGFNH